MTTVISFILVLGLLVLIHELGHYLAARHVGVRVERFSIFFPLPFRSRFIPDRIYARTIGETEYALAWIPLGGYVKLYGQNIDDEDPSDPANYAAKSKWQRAYILVAGPLMNLAAAVVLMAAFFMIGVERPDYQPQVARVEEGSLASQAGFRPGDRIVAIGEQPVPDWLGLQAAVESEAVRKEQLVFTVRRGAQQVTLAVSSMELVAGKPFGARYVIPPVVARVGADSPASQGGMRPGDRIAAVNGKSVLSWGDISPEIQKAAGAPIELEVLRENRPLTLILTPRKDPGSGRWLIHISSHTVLERYGPLEAAWRGVLRLGSLTEGTFLFLGRILTGRGSLDAVGGPVKIGAVIGEAARNSMIQLIFLTAFISLQLGIFNLLPIPALDGGHLFLLAVEAVKRGPLSARVRERTQLVGLSLLIFLILIVTYNDVRQIISSGGTG